MTLFIGVCAGEHVYRTMQVIMCVGLCEYICVSRGACRTLCADELLDELVVVPSDRCTSRR